MAMGKLQASGLELRLNRYQTDLAVRISHLDSLSGRKRLAH